MNFIALAIIYQYDATPLTDFEVQEVPDEAGELTPVITMWNLPDPQPTIQELDAYIASPAFYAMRLADEKELAREKTYTITEAKRGIYITLKVGKLGEYTQKDRETRDWEEDGKPTLPLLFQPSRYPISQKEAPEWGLSQTSLLQWWLDIVITWALATAIITAQERASLLAIEAATTIEAARAAPDSMDWSELPAIPPQPT
ncbi:MAG: hypothetical protein KDI79_26125 [Anaerolineae bacterium]|nr:hypothetical protein [Anaerolineae bacterium]